MNTITTTTLYETFESPIGELLAVGDGEALSGLFMQDGRRPVTALADWERDPEPFGRAPSAARRVLHGRPARVRPRRSPRAARSSSSASGRRCARSPTGETESYGELAARIGRPGSARAVGAANGQNPIAVVVPCHRVIGASGSLTGYAGGLERKRLLLDLESA